MQTAPELITIGQPGRATSLSYYNTTPESPDGEKVLYALFDRLGETSKDPVTGSLWIAGRDGSNAAKVVDLHALTVHNAACQQWIDNETIAYDDGGRVHVVDLDGRQLIEPVAGLLEHEPHGRRVLISRRQPAGDEPAGAYELDIDRGETRLIVQPGDFDRFASRFPETCDPDPARWKVLHLQYNPSATRIAMRFDMGAGEPHRFVMTCRLDGSEPVCFGPKPMHFVWFDDETLLGHDHQVRDGLPDDRSLRRYSLTGECVEQIAGPGNHLGASPDRHWFASESWYHQPVVRLQVYRRGETTPAAVVYEHDRTEPVWGLTFHANPSFSRDGGRVYFNYVDEDGLPRAAMADFDGAH